MLSASVIGLKFQSTQPEWAATLKPSLLIPAVLNFNPRSPSGLRPACSPQACKKLVRFQSTQPEWAATAAGMDYARASIGISIHAARVGCDTDDNTIIIFRKDFNPRSPSGLRQHCQHRRGRHYHISIHAARVGCDPTIHAQVRRIYISIHAARVGCDCIYDAATCQC